MTVTTTTLMRKKIPKTKRIPILPTHKWEDGGYGQRLSHRCRNRNRYFCCCCYCVCEFPQTLAKVCVFLVCGCFFEHFLEHWCVHGVSFFVPKYHKCLGISGFIFVQIKLQSETLIISHTLVQNPHIQHRLHLPIQPKLKKVFQVLQSRGSI